MEDSSYMRGNPYEGALDDEHFEIPEAKPMGGDYFDDYSASVSMDTEPALEDTDSALESAEITPEEEIDYDGDFNEEAYYRHLNEAMAEIRAQYPGITIGGARGTFMISLEAEHEGWHPPTLLRFVDQIMQKHGIRHGGIVAFGADMPAYGVEDGEVFTINDRGEMVDVTEDDYFDDSEPNADLVSGDTRLEDAASEYREHNRPRREHRPGPVEYRSPALTSGPSYHRRRGRGQLR